MNGVFNSWNESCTNSGSNFTASDVSITDDEIQNQIRKEAQWKSYHKAGEAIHTYFLPILVPIGVIGNMFSIAVMMQPRNRRNSTSVYLIGLAVNDCIVLYTALHYWITSVAISNSHITDISLTCKIFVWLFQQASLSGTVLVLAMTADRLIAIKLPLKAKILCKPRKARIVIALTWVGSSMYSIPHLYASDIVPGTRMCVAFYHTGNMSFLSVYSWLSICLNSLVPFIGLLTMNVIIIREIKRSRDVLLRNGGRRSLPSRPPSSRQDSGEPGSNPAATTGSLRRPTKGLCSSLQARGFGGRTLSSRGKGTFRDRQMTVMLLLVTFTLLGLTLPQYIRYVTYSVIDKMKDPESYAFYIFFTHLTNKLFYTNSGVNFFLYCIGGSRFREDLKRILIKLCCLHLFCGQTETPFTRKQCSKSSEVSRC